jgi:SAM-dependent methyltransferase
MRLAERILLALCRRPDESEYEGGTTRATLDNALSFLIQTVPGFVEMARGKDVLDFGCGHGLQAAALAKFCGANVVGLDLPRPALREKWARLQELNLPNLKLTSDPLGLKDRRFDLVISCSSFEHFADPAAILGLMRGYVKTGGAVIVSFAEPWLSPHGSHMDGITRLPWVNVLFPETVVMNVRSRFRRDGAQHYEEVEGGLNRMTIRKFEDILSHSGMRIEHFRLCPVKGLPLVHKIPYVREFLTGAASCVLRP